MSRKIIVKKRLIDLHDLEQSLKHAPDHSSSTSSREDKVRTSMATPPPAQGSGQGQRQNGNSTTPDQAPTGGGSHRRPARGAPSGNSEPGSLSSKQRLRKENDPLTPPTTMVSRKAYSPVCIRSKSPSHLGRTPAGVYTSPDPSHSAPILPARRSKSSSPLTRTPDSTRSEGHPSKTPSHATRNVLSGKDVLAEGQRKLRKVWYQYVVGKKHSDEKIYNFEVLYIVI